MQDVEQVLCAGQIRSLAVTKFYVRALRPTSAGSDVNLESVFISYPHTPFPEACLNSFERHQTIRLHSQRVLFGRAHREIVEDIIAPLWMPTARYDILQGNFSTPVLTYF